MSAKSKDKTEGAFQNCLICLGLMLTAFKKPTSNAKIVWTLETRAWIFCSIITVYRLSRLAT